MNDQSPPKRVTRARAAAKTNENEVKTTKIATASTKAKITRAPSTKRKTRADDVHEDEEQPEQEPEEMNEPPQKPTRSRAKKAVEPEQSMDEAPAPPKPTRGRPKKVVAGTPVPEPTRSLRGRPTKLDVPEEESIAVEEAPKRATRGRAATVTKPTAPKKTVKFEEPDKENIVPAAAKGKAKAVETVTGLRAKPVRKPATTRATRGRKPVEEEQKSSPLSPKKATQVNSNKDPVSEDELATTEKTPMKPLMKSPVKPPGSVFGAKKLDFSTLVTVYHANTSTTQNLKSSIMGSPARRPPQSPFKESMKASAQKLPAGSMAGSMMLQSPFKPSFAAPKAAPAKSPFKASLLQSPARRPQSPTKVSEAGSPTRSGANASIFDATPRASTFKISRFATPRTLTKSVQRVGEMLPPAVPGIFSNGSPLASKQDTNDDADSTMTVPPALTFSGRLSSIMPRASDPAFATAQTVEDIAADPVPDEDEDAVVVDQVDTIVVEETMDAQSTTPPASPPRGSFGFAPREVDENPFQDSDSEDELASASPMYSPIPPHAFKSTSPNFASSLDSPNRFVNKPRNVAQAMRSEQRANIVFTPLARQLNDWIAASPEKQEDNQENSEPTTPTAASPLGQRVEAETTTAAEPSPVKSTFFEDEMTIRDELESAPEPPMIEPDLLEDNFEPVELLEEDLDLALEADEMSMLEPEQLEAPAPEEMFTTEETTREEIFITEESTAGEPFAVEEPTPEQLLTVEEPALSEASQEYGDENEMPIDPELLALPAPEPQAAPIFSTPQPKRPLSERVFHTISKVPLKAAAEDSPMRPSPVKRSQSISRLPVQRPTISRSNMVISYSQTKGTPRSQREKQTENVEMQDVTTPSKPEGVWSNMGTPARTPRRDIDTSLLEGAIVFVDVHTTEGADASVLFTELLTQMGARCVKSWGWNGSPDASDKIGITHVVYKDGGKRTLEKVKQSGGVVSCVGVGWVLDCERENKWLDEASYIVDAAIIPRGGSRRRKSMEPRALANMNGTLVSTPGRKVSPSFGETPVTSKSRRRDSVQWVRSPSTSSEEKDDQTLLLSPIPATPAPETISAYGEDGLYGETPGGQTPYFLHKEQLVQKTAPVKRYVETEHEDSGMSGIGSAFLSEQKDETVMMRLMAARRKSLQWAPKVGSPLARGMF